MNNKRALIQFENPSFTKPKPGDIIIFGSTALNSYGHVAIITETFENKIEIIQQNPGPYSKSY